MKFVQNFRRDLKQIRFTGEPYALVRFGDGERAFCEHRPITAGAERWHYDGTDTATARKVLQTVTADEEELYIGISCPCCDASGHAWYMSTVRAPADRITYANIFVNGNYSTFKRKLDALPRDAYTLVSCKHGDITVPANCINPEFDYSDVVVAMQASNKPIFVAAGPIKCGIIYDYWTTTHAKDRQIVLDVGSAMDSYIHGKPTRRYHIAGTPTSTRICRWSA